QGALRTQRGQRAETAHCEARSRPLLPVHLREIPTRLPRPRHRSCRDPRADAAVVRAAGATDTPESLAMDMTSRLHSTMRLLVAPGVALHGASARARARGDLRPLLEPAPAISFVSYHAPPLSIMTPASIAGGGLMAAATHSEQLPKGAELE